MMRSVRQVVRLAMGGAIWGGLLGIPLGAAVGLLLGLWFGNVSWGLDGAVLGILGLSGVGAAFGALQGMTGDEPATHAADEGRPVLPPR
jgi:hypothetical protein